jgi:hypothetical protein
MKSPFNPNRLPSFGIPESVLALSRLRRSMRNVFIPPAARITLFANKRSEVFWP